MKRLLSFFLCITMLITLTGCDIFNLKKENANDGVYAALTAIKTGSETDVLERWKNVYDKLEMPSANELKTGKNTLHPFNFSKQQVLKNVSARTSSIIRDVAISKPTATATVDIEYVDLSEAYIAFYDAVHDTTWMTDEQINGVSTKKGTLSDTFVECVFSHIASTKPLATKDKTLKIDLELEDKIWVVAPTSNNEEALSYLLGDVDGFAGSLASKDYQARLAAAMSGTSDTTQNKPDENSSNNEYQKNPPTHGEDITNPDGLIPLGDTATLTNIAITCTNSATAKTEGNENQTVMLGVTMTIVNRTESRFVFNADELMLHDSNWWTYSQDFGSSLNKVKKLELAAGESAEVVLFFDITGFDGSEGDCLAMEVEDVATGDNYEFFVYAEQTDGGN